MMKAVTRVAGFDVQTERLPEAVRAAKMRMTRAAALVRANEHGVVVRRVLIEKFPACEV